MSETQSTLFNKSVRHLWIAGAFVLLAVVVVVRVLSPSPPIPEPVKERTETEPRRVHQTRPVFDSKAYYQTIIDNNLFRPLGWMPPRRIEPYRLIGTILPRSATTPPKAILQTTAGEKTYIVSMGEKLDASTEVVSIAGKSVVLSENGESRTLRLNTGVYLNPSAAMRSARRLPAAPRRVAPRPGPVRSRATPAASRRVVPLPARRRPLSEWETVEGERIRLGDARLKNPVKWGLRRR